MDVLITKRSPNNFGQFVRAEKFISFKKVAVTEEAVKGRKRRRMGRLKNKMFRLVNKRLFATSITTPKQEDKVVAMFVKILDSGFSKSLPAFAAVRAGAMSLDSQDVIEQKYTLFLPGF